MDTAWQTSIDRTLRNTEATLESLQLRRSSYDRAKHKVDDYLGYTTPHRDGGGGDGFDSLDRADLSVPPPLPRHRRYQSTRDTLFDSGDAAYGSPASGPSPRTRGDTGASSLPPPPQQPSSSSVLGGAGRRGNGAASRDDPTAPLQLVNAQVRGALLELELEKAKRADSIRELAYRTTAELAELRSIVTQLQGENAALRTSVKALEGKLGYVPELRHTSSAAGVSGGATHVSFSELTASPPTMQQQQPSRTVLLASAISNSGFALPNHHQAGASASLVARVEALESSLARQQQMTDERQTRTATVLREMVKAEIAADVAAMRTVAREAARDSTEELLKLRLSAVQSSVQTEVQRALRAASASEATAQQAQLQCGEVEHRLNTQLQRLNTQFLEWQRGATGAAGASPSAGSVIPFSGGAHQERQQQLERVVEEEVHALRGQLRQLRQDTEAHLQRLAQEQQQAQTQLQKKVSSDDFRSFADRLEEQQRSGSSGTALREQVTAVVRPQLQTVVDALRKLQESTQEQQEAAEAWWRQAGLRFASTDAAAKELRDAVDQQEQQSSACVKEVRQVRAEAAAAQLSATDALRQCKMELTETFETRLQATEARAQAARRDAQQQLEEQLRPLQLAVTDQQEAAQRSRLITDAIEERLRRAEATITATESAATHGVEAVKAKCDAVYAVVQQTCSAPLSRVQQDMEAAQRRLQALDEERTRSNAVWTQQLAETRHFLEDHVRNAREMLEQRLAHQKELCEELRGQQSAQRRYAEEQQQQTLEQLMRLQLQLQTQQQQQQQQQQPQSPAVHVAVQARKSAEEVVSPLEGLQARSEALVDDTGASPDATLGALHSLEQQLQLLSPRLHSLEARVVAVERAAADAITPLQRQLEELQTQLADNRKEQEQQRSALARAVEEEARRAAAACEGVATAASEQVRRVEGKMDAAAAPAQVASRLCSNAEALQRLALHLQDHLRLPASAAQALAALETQATQHAQTIEELRGLLGEAQQQVKQVVAEAAAERGDAAAAAQTAAAAQVAEERVNVGISSQEVADMRAELQAMHERQAAAEQRHTTLETTTHLLANEQLPALSRALDSLSTTTQPLPQQLEQLADQVAGLQSAQRQQLPTLQKYVQDVVDVMQESHAAALDPLQMRVRAVEDRQRKAQAGQDEWMAAQAAAAEEATLGQQKKAEQVQRDWEARAAAQLSAMKVRVTTTDASVAAALQKVNAVEHRQQEVGAALEELRATTEEVAEAQRVAAAATAEAKKAPSVPAETEDDGVHAVSDNLEDTSGAAEVATLPLSQLQHYVAELGGRLSLLEEQTSDSVAVTADALGAFGQQLQDVVSRFAATVERGSETAAASGAAADASPSSSPDATTTAVALSSDSSAITSLEDVFAYFLRQLQQLQRALFRLQANTVETLEILEQHEESTAALPMLQHTVDAIAAALVPLAERLGVEATTFSFSPDALDHHADVYPPSHDGSESTLGEN